MGIGGAPEGVLTAAALRCLNGEIQARLLVKDEKQVKGMQQMGITDLNRIYSTEDLAPAKNIIFAATGVTDEALLKGVRFFGDGVRTHSLVLNLSERKVQFVDTVHLDTRPDIKVRL
jgi:fructose-1,6-bisphosphatase/sedoheptulose 1,7-bisphosphatase-like protein